MHARRMRDIILHPNIYKIEQEQPLLRPRHSCQRHFSLVHGAVNAPDSVVSNKQLRELLLRENAEKCTPLTPISYTTNAIVSLI